MTKKSAEDNLLDFIKGNYGWHASGELQRMSFYNKDGTLASARSLVRRLEENTYHPTDNPTGILEVQYGNKNAASYRIRQECRSKKLIKVGDSPQGNAIMEWITV